MSDCLPLPIPGRRPTGLGLLPRRFLGPVRGTAAIGGRRRVYRDDHVDVALVGGAGRARPFVILRPSGKIKDKETFLDDIWPLVEKINQECSETGRIVRELVIVVDSETTFPETTKKTVARKDTFSDYEAAINKAYASLDL